MLEKAFFTVVVADDEDELREAFCRMIPWKDLGFELVGDAGNGLDALELVEEKKPDLLVTDIRMPFISGIELARQVREIRPAMNIAFLSGFDDFEYAKQAIQYNIISYMLKPLTRDGLIKELTLIHEKMDTQFQIFREQTSLQGNRENFLMSLLLDDYYDIKQREEKLVQSAVECGLLQGQEDFPKYIVMVLSIFEKNGDNCTQPATVQTVEMVTKKYFRQYSFFSCGKVVTLLMGNRSDFAEYLHILAEELVQIAERVTCRNCNIGVSGETDRISELHGAYREAMETVGYVEPGESNILFLSDVQQAAAGHMDGISELVTRIEVAFKSGAREEVNSGLEQLISLGRTEQRGKIWLDIATLQLISEIYQILYATGGSEAVSIMEHSSLRPNISFHYRSTTELKKGLLEFCDQAMDYMRCLQKTGGSLLCQRALNAIEENYKDESLSLVSLSSILGVSPNHLSTCIKKYAGETFINILIRKRMDAARELLLATPMKIMEIAQQCGYNDQHYFSYCFKKYCGISPNALRRTQTKLEGSGR